MEYIEKKIKGYKRTYKTKTGETKETTPNLSIYLGNQTPFKPDDTIIIINKDEFQELLNNTTETPETIQEIQELKESLEDEKNNSLQLLNNNTKQTKQIQELQETIEGLQTELTETKKELQEQTNNYNKSNDKKEKLYNSIIVLQQENSYLEKIIIAYEQMGAFKRLIKTNPKNTIAPPETIDLEKLETKD